MGDISETFAIRRRYWDEERRRDREQFEFITRIRRALESPTLPAEVTR